MAGAWPAAFLLPIGNQTKALREVGPEDDDGWNWVKKGATGSFKNLSKDMRAESHSGDL